MGSVGFFDYPGRSAVTEVTEIIAGSDNATYDELIRGINVLKAIAADVPAYISANAPWMEFIGSSNVPYRVFIEGSEPFFVFALIETEWRSDDVFVLQVGVRNGLSPGQFYPLVQAEILTRTQKMGWRKP